MTVSSLYHSTYGPAGVFPPAERTMAEAHFAAFAAITEAFARNVDRVLPLDVTVGRNQWLVTDLLADAVSEEEVGRHLLAAIHLARTGKPLEAADVLRRMSDHVAEDYAFNHSGAWE